MRVIGFFMASCPYCKAFKPTFEQVMSRYHPGDAPRWECYDDTSPNANEGMDRILPKLDKSQRRATYPMVVVQTVDGQWHRYDRNKTANPDDLRVFAAFIKNLVGDPPRRRRTGSTVAQLRWRYVFCNYNDGGKYAAYIYDDKGRKKELGTKYRTRAQLL